MPAVNWDQPSCGSVNDPVEPALSLENLGGPALRAASQGTAMEAQSDEGEALRAFSADSITGRFESGSYIALYAFAPGAYAVAGTTYSHLAPAVIGLARLDPSIDPEDQPTHGYGVMGVAEAVGGTGVHGFATAERAIGVIGQAPEGTGMVGKGGSGPGVVGRSEGSDGVQGFGLGYGAAGVRARCEHGPGMDAESAEGDGVAGTAHAGDAAGVRGVNDGSGGVGVAARVEDGTAVSARANKGVCVDAQSFDADGIRIETFQGLGLKVRCASRAAIDAFSWDEAGVKAGCLLGPAVDAFGISTGIAAGAIDVADADDLKKGCAVFGCSLGHAGVCGLGIVGPAVLGIAAHPLLLAGHFQGTVFVDGILMKRVSLFSIDHPLDPERRLLQHAAVEGPEYKTFYDGIVTLDRKGRARVRLPRWFSALNEELRYQLTPLGRPAPELHVAAEVEGNVFVIAGGLPGQRICWQVTGVRRDAWAKANPIEVEARKPASRRRGAASAEAIEKVTEELREQARAAKARRKPARRPAPGAAAAKARIAPPETPGVADLAEALAPLAGVGAGGG